MTRIWRWWMMTVHIPTLRLRDRLAGQVSDERIAAIEDVAAHDRAERGGK